MAPATGTALLLLVVFVLPGFVALQYRERTYVTKPDDTPFERLLNALYFSFLTYLILFGIALLLGAAKDDIAEFYSGEKSHPLGVGALLPPRSPRLRSGNAQGPPRHRGLLRRRELRWVHRGDAGSVPRAAVGAERRRLVHPSRAGNARCLHPSRRDRFRRVLRERGRQRHPVVT